MLTYADGIAITADIACEWLEDWGTDLELTSEDYRHASVTGEFNGRRIDKDFAKMQAKLFHERAKAVYNCGEPLKRDILKRIK